MKYLILSFFVFFGLAGCKDEPRGWTAIDSSFLHRRQIPNGLHDMSFFGVDSMAIYRAKAIAGGWIIETDEGIDSVSRDSAEANYHKKEWQYPKYISGFDFGPADSGACPMGTIWHWSFDFDYNIILKGCYSKKRWDSAEAWMDRVMADYPKGVSDQIIEYKESKPHSKHKKQ